ncbi:MAG: DUF2255 family protein [Altibacter sp.]|uniref:DUF2255 family protein n=1 Tax=Altibacter sp. TaxID=2024823 RepID=UPI001E14D9C8|nr:DUF2255 family protein [Altibacter sp.]MBZ0327631.1 DUF2255 family protein [Altibacter sp.]
MGFPTDFFTHLKQYNYVEIKGGLDRITFLEIWMVAVGERVFARSWNKSERSWFTAFLETGVGELKYGQTVLSVSGVKVEKEDKIQPFVHDAYRKRFTEKENIYYVDGITQPEYEAYTMEFFTK